MATILVIEDEKLLREDIGEVLLLEDFEVVEAPNGRVGVQTALERQPDLILCDISMPEMDGYEVLTELRKHTSTAEIPFIFLTARVDTEFVRRAEGMGVDEYMTKPFSNSELMATIRSFLRQREIFLTFQAASLETLIQQLCVLVTHELRGYSVAASIEGLIRRQLDEATSDRMLALVNSGSHHLRYLTQQLTNLARLEFRLITAEKILHTGMIVGVWSLLHSALNQAKQLTQHRPTEVVRLDGSDEQIYVQCNARALRQALADVIAQALNSNRSVLISQRVADQRVTLAVRHNGVPPAAPDVPALLHGTAHALRLSGQIIHLHGGTLRVDEQGQVEIELPLMALNLRYG